MFDRFFEYKEAQQFRKDRMRRRNMRYLVIFMAILGAVFVVVSIVNAISPPAKSATKQTVSTQIVSKQKQEIKEFADIVTKPLDTLTKEDLDLVDAKADDPCYAKNAKLPQDQMIKAISACKAL
jgi:cell division protein FtsB